MHGIALEVFPCSAEKQDWRENGGTRISLNQLFKGVGYHRADSSKFLLPKVSILINLCLGILCLSFNNHLAMQKMFLQKGL